MTLYCFGVDVNGKGGSPVLHMSAHISWCYIRLVSGRSVSLPLCGRARDEPRLRVGIAAPRTPSVRQDSVSDGAAQSRGVDHTVPSNCEDDVDEEKNASGRTTRLEQHGMLRTDVRYESHGPIRGGRGRLVPRSF